MFFIFHIYLFKYSYLAHVLFNLSLTSGPRQISSRFGLGQANCQYLSNMGENEYNDCKGVPITV